MPRLSAAGIPRLKAGEDVNLEGKDSGKFAVNSKKTPPLPEGVYPVVLSYSERFNRWLPELITPHQTRVRLYGGDTLKPTEGCIKVGKDAYPDDVSGSKLAIFDLMEILHHANMQGKKLSITVQNSLQ